MAAWTEVASNAPLCGEKPVGLARGVEPAHRSLRLARWLVGVLRPIGQAFVLSVLHAGQQVCFRCCIAAELIRDEYARDVVTPFQQLTEEFLGCGFSAAALHQDILDIPLLIKGAPEILVFPVDGEKDLLEMPLVAGLRRPPRHPCVLIYCGSPETSVLERFALR